MISIFTASFGQFTENGFLLPNLPFSCNVRTDMISAELLKDCRAGKRAAQAEVYRLLAPKMFVVCQRYVKAKCAAEDILQEGFANVFIQLHTYRQEGVFEGWVRKIMVNCALQHIRRNRNLRSISPEREPGLQSLADNNWMPGQLDAGVLLKLIRNLPQGYQTVFNLYVFEELTHREIAVILNISEGTSKSNLHDARRILQQQLRDYRNISSSRKAG